MIEDKAKQAALARTELQTAMANCAAALTMAAEVLTASALELTAAAERENQAVGAYVSELEKQISRQGAALS